MSSDSNALIDGIISEARKKAEKIIDDAAREAGRIMEDAHEEAERKKEAEKRAADVRLGAIRLKEESAKRSIDRLTELKMMDYSYSVVMERVGKEFETLAKEGKLRDSIVSWIAEAAIGLDKSSAVVSSSVLYPVDDSMLRDAERLVKAKTGASLSLSHDERKTNELGVIASSIDGKISYNNLLSTRIRRLMKEIRKIVQEENAR